MVDVNGASRFVSLYLSATFPEIIYKMARSSRSSRLLKKDQQD